MSDMWFGSDGRQYGGPYHSFCAVFESADMDVDVELTRAAIGEVAAVYLNEHDWGEDELQFQLEDACADYGYDPADWSW